MRLYVITECDDAAADRSGRQMAGVPLDAVIYGDSERGKSTADAVVKCQEKLDTPEMVSELCENKTLTDRERAKAVKEMITERFKGCEKVAAIMPAEFFGNSFGAVIMKMSDEAIDNGAAFGCHEGAISSFAVGTSAEASFVNSTLHLKVSDPEMIKNF